MVDHRVHRISEHSLTCSGPCALSICVEQFTVFFLVCFCVLVVSNLLCFIMGMRVI